MSKIDIENIFKINPITYKGAQFAYAQPDLSEEEINRLIIRSRDGDVDAGKKLILSHLKIVYHIVANGYYLGSLAGEIDDLINEGVLGLYQAIERFDSEKATYATYAGYWVRKMVSLFISEKTNVIRYGEKQQRKIKELEKVENKYESKYGREPTPAVLAELTGKSVKSIHEILRMKACYKVASLDWIVEDRYAIEEVYGGLENTELSVKSHEDNVINKCDAEQAINAIRKTLKKKIDLRIVEFFLNADSGATYKDCAEALSVTRQYISKRINEMRKILK